MKILLVLLLVAMLSACTPANGLNLAKAEYLCRDHGGLYNFRSIREEPVVCSDGTKFDVQDVSEVIIKDHKYLPE